MFDGIKTHNMAHIGGNDSRVRIPVAIPKAAKGK
jgi:hypothetical protein